MNKRNIVHIEIPTQNGKESADFYEKLFDWHIEHDEQMDYTMFDPHDGPGGGFSPLGENVHVGDILIYVNSDDIEADLKKAEISRRKDSDGEIRDSQHRLVRRVPGSDREPDRSLYQYERRIQPVILSAMSKDPEG